MALEISVSLYHRDHFSTGRNRQVFGYEAFHWGIVVGPPGEQEGRVYDAYDTTDTSVLDPVTFRMTNPTMDWILRSKEGVNPALSVKLIGRVVIGTAPAHVTKADLKELFSQVPKPVKNTDPQQSCVTWVVRAIEALQKQGWIHEFDIAQFKDWVLAYADEVHSKDGSRRGKLETYQK
jgi:hypothetical protein